MTTAIQKTLRKEIVKTSAADNRLRSQALSLSNACLIGRWPPADWGRDRDGIGEEGRREGGMDEGMKRFPFAKRFRVGGNRMGNHYGRMKEKLTVRPQSANPPNH